MSDKDHDENSELDSMDDYDGDDFCIDCGETFRYDDCGGYNPPCLCGFHCRSCHEAAEREDDDDGYDEDDYPGDGEEEHMRATERFWDGRVGHSAEATDDNELPF